MEMWNPEYGSVAEMHILCGVLGSILSPEKKEREKKPENHLRLTILNERLIPIGKIYRNKEYFKTSVILDSVCGFYMS